MLTDNQFSGTDIAQCVSRLILFLNLYQRRFCASRQSQSYHAWSGSIFQTGFQKTTFLGRNNAIGFSQQFYRLCIRIVFQAFDFMKKVKCTQMFHTWNEIIENKIKIATEKTLISDLILKVRQCYKNLLSKLNPHGRMPTDFGNSKEREKLGLLFFTRVSDYGCKTRETGDLLILNRKNSEIPRLKFAHFRKSRKFRNWNSLFFLETSIFRTRNVRIKFS